MATRLSCPARLTVDMYRLPGFEEPVECDDAAVA